MNKQSLIKKLRSLAKIWNPIEVAEVDIAALGSGKDPGEKKNSINNSEICSTQTLYISKESWEQSSLRFDTKLFLFNDKVAPRILMISIALGADYSFVPNSIDPYVPTFFFI